jgi:hypothetical protein
MTTKKRRAPSFPKAPFIFFDGGKPNSVRLISQPGRSFISSSSEFTEPNARRACAHHGATIPEDSNGPAALPLFCLAPHGVFRASRIASRAVSSYLAFSPLPALFSKNRRCLFCDTFRHRSFSTAAPAYFTRHAAVWCSDFPPASLIGSPAIICHRQANYHKIENLEARNPGSNRKTRKRNKN